VGWGRKAEVKRKRTLLPKVQPQRPPKANHLAMRAQQKKRGGRSCTCKQHTSINKALQYEKVGQGLEKKHRSEGLTPNHGSGRNPTAHNVEQKRKSGQEPCSTTRNSCQGGFQPRGKNNCRTGSSPGRQPKVTHVARVCVEKATVH
jgi:hypothetical protein